MMITKLKVFGLLLACACGLGAKAEVVETVNLSAQGYADAESVTEVVSGDVTLSFSKATGSNEPKYYNSGTAVRCYANNTLTVSVPEGGVIKSVAFTFVSTSYAIKSNPAETGAYADNAWTGEAAGSVVFTNSTGSQWRIQTITVTYDEGTAASVATPEISLPTGNYRGVQTVTITAEEGASIYYTTDGETPTTESTPYAVPFTVSETTTVKAIAVKGGESSKVATSVITIVEEVTTIADFIAAGEGITMALTLTDAVITAKNATGTNVYMQDATGGILFYGSVPECNVGDKVSGTIIGEYAIFANNHELINGDFSEATFTAGGVITPAEVTLAELIAEPSAHHMCLVTVKGCTYDGANIVQGESSVMFYDIAKALASDYVWPAQFDFTGLYLYYNAKTPELAVRSEADIVNTSSLEVPEFAWSATNVVYDMNNPTALPTLTNNSDGALSFSSSNTDVATVAADGTVTVLAEGETTITAEVAASDNFSAASASYTLKVVNTVALGEAVAFVVALDGTSYAMSTLSSASNIMDAAEVYAVNGKVVNAVNKAELSWFADKENGTIQTADGTYLTGGTSTSLSVKAAEFIWTWDADQNIFLSGNETTPRTFLYQKEAAGFRNYAISNAGKTVSNYTYSTLPEMMTFADGYIRSGLEASTWGTICLPNAVADADVAGATFYPVAGKVVADGKVSAIVLGEAVTALQAGVPYVFSATAADVVAAYTGDAVTSATAANGLTGTFEDINADKDEEDTQLSGKYVLADGVWKLCGKGCSLAANRAYIDMEAVPAVEAGADALTISVSDGVLTGIESVAAAASSSVDVYTISGVRVRASVSAAQATEGLQKGLYIVNGKKVLVK